MTLDRTKKYKVGEVVFEWADASKAWIDDTALLLKEMDLARFNPVEVEEPIKWGFQTSYVKVSRKLTSQEWLADADFAEFDGPAVLETMTGNWRHEVVSTRIG